jgi:hypothetical protein
MRLHIDVLGSLHLVWGAFGVMTGLSLAILAAGTRAALAREAFGVGEQAAVAILGLGAALLLLGGGAAAVAGWGLRRRFARARLASLILAVPNLILVPFGTALGVYTLWVLLNDDARRAFGRPPRTVVPVTEV